MSIALMSTGAQASITKLQIYFSAEASKNRFNAPTALNIACNTIVIKSAFVLLF